MLPTSFRSYQLFVATTLGLAALRAVPLRAQTAQPPLASDWDFARAPRKIIPQPEWATNCRRPGSYGETIYQECAI